MSFRDSPSLRKAMVVVCCYYLLTYSCLVIIFICARAMYPTEFLASLNGIPDSVMPEMAKRLAPHPFIAGLLLASPYAAVMSAVAAFLLVLSSSLVRDIYQRNINPNVSTKRMKVINNQIRLSSLIEPKTARFISIKTGAVMISRERGRGRSTSRTCFIRPGRAVII